MIDSAGVGDDVLTTGGIYGDVIEAEDDDLVVEIADGITVHMTRRGIAPFCRRRDEDPRTRPRTGRRRGRGARRSRPMKVPLRTAKNRLELPTRRRAEADRR